MAKVSSLSSSFRSVAANPQYGKPNVIRKDHLICTYCGVYGHTIKKCYKLHYLPRGFKVH